MNAIEIKNLHFSYGKENVLDGVSLCLKEGRLAILAGENGAGKSTLLRLLLGELPIGENPKGDQEEGSSDGSIEILGQDIRQFKDWSSISYVPQNGMPIKRFWYSSMPTCASAALTCCRSFFPANRNNPICLYKFARTISSTDAGKSFQPPIPFCGT